ncbi:phospholipid carrier-dependent glycosyltransferase [Paenibacillus cremeus]|uniref:Polyprenol-phosphate-mannose--protein mannosyltransferase n=1 Tax=Paenibacillus cremeus TaxID=2163881 RepID=A0A559K562_9BACL|nr:phospholipid carrier-dependent glycosyltransferase [Paenibacillus cremeus]TVY07233.1 phospholipid carrier-dependent glycosyltransferase [Paenibacillus cremeus]
MLSTWVIGLFFTLFFAAIYDQLLRKDELFPNNRQSTYRLGWTVLAIGLVIRVILAYRVVGYEPDVTTFKSWAGQLASGGPGSLYRSGMFADYPPGYMYVLWLIGQLQSLFQLGWDSPGMLVLLKSPAILTDLALSILMFNWAMERRLKLATAFGIALLFLFNPAIILNSAAWGQVDSVFMALILFYLRFMERGRWNAAAALLALAVLMKPQALLLAPLFLLAWIRLRSWRIVLNSALTGAATFILLSLPFVLHQRPKWLFELYFSTLASYPYASLNAFNLPALLGGNFAPLHDRMLLGLSYQTCGTALMIALYGYIVVLFFKSKKEAREALFPLLSFLVMAGVFTFMGKMHERYLYYALPLVLYSFIRCQDRRLLFLYLGFTLTHFMNVSVVLQNSFQQLYHISKWDAGMLAISAANVGLLLYALILSWSLLTQGRVRLICTVDSGFTSKLQQLSDKRSLLLLGALMLVYSALALYHLGSHQGPVTLWKPEKAGETVILDLGRRQTITNINTYAGIGDGSFSIALSDEGLGWRNSITEPLDVYKGFAWWSQAVSGEARYVKLKVEQPGFSLFELALFGPDSSAPLPIVSWETDGDQAATTAGKLFDEQSAAPKVPSYENGAYFDEIYYVRTAYEHLHGMEPYETTHPPLGKLFIAFGIWLFGLNPFGWRIIGTLFGIGMIPLMYLYGKTLFGRAEYGLAAAFLFTFDCLHFVQTRIATIDVYAVFFILLTFYFMYRYTTTPCYTASFSRSLLPLGLSGLFFGMGAASKWIVLYGGAGLAFLLFAHLLVQFRAYREARRRLYMQQTALSKAQAELLVALFPRRTFWTLAWCLLCFVVVPGAIYLLSYVPFMAVPGPGHTLIDVLKNQVGMYSYHENLKATHPFSSSWWQWPEMSKPVWYYAGVSLPEGQISSITAIGNPLIWWVGFIAMLAVTFIAVKRKQWSLTLLSVAFFSQYLPWTLVPRLTFIYHYFAMVPFSGLALTYFYKQLKEKLPDGKNYAYGFLAAVFGLFLLFYPVLSGAVISRSFAEHALRWFPQWIFF